MNAADLTGVWLLRSFQFEEVETGLLSEPLGEHPAGTIMFHPYGRFFALLTAGERPTPANALERAADYERLVAYSGAYRLEMPNMLVTHVDMAWFPSWIGTEQRRFCTLRGDELDLVSAPLYMPGTIGTRRQVIAHVGWRREGTPQHHELKTPGP